MNPEFRKKFSYEISEWMRYKLMIIFNEMNMVITNNNNNNITFINLFRLTVIKRLIFNHVRDISIYKQGVGARRHGGHETQSLKGSDIVMLPDFGMISRFAMTWDFIKHYLPDNDKAVDINIKMTMKTRGNAISHYCKHTRSNLETLIHLIDDWSPDFDPNSYWGIVSSLASNNRYDILEYLIKKYPNIGVFNAMESAVVSGSLPIVQLLQSFKKPALNTIVNAINIAADYGHLNVITYLHEMNNNSNIGKSNYYETSTIASSKGHLHVLKFLHENGYPFYYEAMDKAAANGYIEIVKFLHENRSEGCSKQAMDKANSLEMIQYLHTHRTEGCSKQAMDNASGCGKLDVVKWLHENRSEGCSTGAMDHAKTFEIVQYLHTHRTEGCTKEAIDTASLIGRLDTVEFLHFHRTEGATKRAMDCAAYSGHLNILQVPYLSIYPCQIN
ncbi:hypothetical protein DFA_00318 [Cavenderia fasciculata]|uniref:Ankyrin repeat-containing protein n=1 Tax=Cavenderia fasciculata TaxID=261658 RepID=F4PY80_CACFS|nr:uncharacterized protein DFA_00318 [Cavenderia fasciculata]EGG19740.1 hypothetical protein DFA_00318 [Cavenderia fasciculata]|eukprot:XP_004358034.1 hypothetical protein DFA_00318 [Cavenderia fasciculata]